MNVQQLKTKLDKLKRETDEMKEQGNLRLTALKAVHDMCERATGGMCILAHLLLQNRCSTIICSHPLLGIPTRWVSAVFG